MLRLFVRHGLLDPAQAANMRTWRGTGGFSLDGSVRVEAHDRASLSLTPLELLGRLARLIPPPRAHRHRYLGVLAPNARLRADVVRHGRPDDELRRLDDLHRAAQASSSDGSDRPACIPSPTRIRWAQLLARVYELDPLRCPGCDGTLRILAFLTEPDVVEGILRHLALPHPPPRLAPARAPPQAEIDFDQTPHWEREAEGTAPPRPHLDPFDQSLPDDDGTWSA